ncbi:MAG: hypothetical protein JNL21_23005 [Myxococcales bacterium]|nr:hypothetical protein [Myxococcales bacterium]
MPPANEVRHRVQDGGLRGAERHPELLPRRDESPHAAELVDSHGTIGAEIVQRADRAYLALLVRVIEESELDPKRMKLSATAAAQLLLRAASGAAYDAKTPAAHRRHVAEIVRAIVAGMRGAH